MIVATIQPKIGETSVKNHLSRMKRDMGGEQEAAYPIPVELIQDSEAWKAKI